VLTANVKKRKIKYYQIYTPMDFFEVLKWAFYIVAIIIMTACVMFMGVFIWFALALWSAEQRAIQAKSQKI
jgi:hypothetical protein